MMADPADDRILRAKYLDWCSAKVADRFLELTPDQIYELAHPLSRSDSAAGERGSDVSVAGAGASSAASRASASISSAAPAPSGASMSPRVLSSGDADGGLLYRSLVERVTEVLAAKLRLPSFESWKEEYRAAPEQYEEELLGLWRHGV